MSKQFIVLILLAGLLTCCMNRKVVTVQVENPTDLQRKDALIVIDLEKLSRQLGDKGVMVQIGEEEIPSQRDGNKLYFVTDFDPRETKTLILQPAAGISYYTQRAHAELSHKEGGHFEGKQYIGGVFKLITDEIVPVEHVDHDTYYRFEGPGWESDKVGYRFYLDQRNRIDIFGKRVTRIVLPEVELDGLDSYHELSEWGADIFKVGESLGIGSVGTFVNGAVRQIDNTDSIRVRILADGPIRAQIRTDYYGWEINGHKVHLESFLSIHAGTRLTKHHICIYNGLKNLVTGLVKADGSNYIKGTSVDSSGWNYIALWGKQSLTGDNLGTAIFYRNADLIVISEDELNYLLVLKPTDQMLTYYFAAAWEAEPGGIKTESEFVDYLQENIIELNNPIQVIY